MTQSRRLLRCAQAVRAALSAGFLPLLFPVSAYAQAAPVTAEAAVVAYEDAVLTTDAQEQPSAQELQREQDNLLGLPRSLRLDYYLNSTKTNNVKSRTSGLSAAVAIDTQHYGALALTLNLSQSSTNTGRRELWRIDQRAMPFNNGWLGHHALGTINTVVTPLARGISRLTLPSIPIEGVTAQYQRLATDVNASLGRVGLFSGRDLDGFNASGGSLFSVGGQTRVNVGIDTNTNTNTNANANANAPRIDLAAQFMQTLDVTQGVAADTSSATNAQNTTSLYLSGAWQGRAPWIDAALFGASGVGNSGGSNNIADQVYGLQTQAGLVLSQIRPAAGSVLAPERAAGLWQDLVWRTPAWRQAASLYYFQPNLAWGNSSLPGDLQGLMYRAETSSRQLSFGFSGELNSRIKIINNAARDASLFATANARYRISNDLGLNAALTVRTGDSPTNAMQFTVDHLNVYGNAQWRASWLTTPKSDTAKLGFDQAWKIGAKEAFSTALSYEIDRTSTRQDSTWIWNALGSFPVPLTSSATISGVISGTQSSRRFRGAELPRGAISAANPANLRDFSDDTFTASTRNIALQFATPIGRSWTFSAHYTLSNGRAKRDTTVLSPFEIASTPSLPTLTEAGSILFLVRYGAAAGSNQIPLGRRGAVSGAGFSVGAGRIEGTVFFDNNGDGTRQADEAGVPNVSLLLNGRYLARSDNQGRYVFDYVATGEQQLEVVPDNVPLPWSPKDRDAVTVQVLVRETTTTNFALQR